MSRNRVEQQLRQVSALSDAQATDGLLLEAFLVDRDEAAFTALVRRYGSMVFGICRRVLRHQADAEDAFQATFLVLVRRTAQVRCRATLGNWLYGVAYRTALHARTVNARRRRLEGQARPLQHQDSPEEAVMRPELQQLLNSELNRLPAKYRETIVLCDLLGKTLRDAARELRCPEGTVCSRLARGRELLRKRLLRGGEVLSVGALAAYFAQNKASASALVIETTVKTAALLVAGNIAAAGGLAPNAAALMEGVLKSMLLTKLKIATGLLLVLAVLGATTSLIACRSLAGPPTGPPAPAPEKAQGAKVVQANEEKPKKKVEHNGPISPGIQALATASTDIIIADVVDTNPTKAEEGARDTVKLKVVKTMLGQPAPGETLSVYYHLLWADEKAETLERVKFEKGQRYVVFLKSHISDRGPEGKQVEYELTDQWLSVLQDRSMLVREIAAAIRVPHGDACGAWSEPVGPLQARLVAYRTEPSNGTPIITLYLDVRNVAGGDNTKEFNLDKASAIWKVTDAAGKEIAPTSPPGNWLPTPPKKLVLEAHQSGRLRLSITGGGIAKDHGGQLELGFDRVWVFDKGDEKAYYLSGEIKIQPTRDTGVWSGTINLPKVKLPIEPE